MAVAKLDGDAITDWDSFHDVCAAEFGFPDFYGRNMDAWIDCLSYVDVGDGMSRLELEPAETLRIELSNSESLKRRAPEIFNSLIGCTRFVNERFVIAGEHPRLELALL
jgi:RNAse (barnase) inhibitor barstar